MAENGQEEQQEEKAGPGPGLGRGKHDPGPPLRPPGWVLAVLREKKTPQIFIRNMKQGGSVPRDLPGGDGDRGAEEFVLPRKVFGEFEAEIKGASPRQSCRAGQKGPESSEGSCDCSILHSAAAAWNSRPIWMG